MKKMVIFRETDQINIDEPIVLALGFFDGIHKGHQAVLQSALTLAKEQAAVPIALTFYPHPMSVLAPEISVPLLISEKEKEALLDQMGFKGLVVIKSTKEFLAQSAVSFLEKLKDIPKLVGIVTGENFGFGRGAEGNTELISSYFSGSDVIVDTVPLKKENESIVSSTLIRERILQGNVKEASLMLGRNYSIHGDIVHGFRRGTRVLGFPTANLKPEKGRVIPGDGVYATHAWVRGKRYPAITNVGTNPTFGDKDKSIETFIFSFDENIYDASFCIEWIDKIRDEIKFPDADALRRQIEKDVEQAKEIMT